LRVRKWRDQLIQNAKDKEKNADALFVSWNQYNQHVIWEEKRVKGYKEEGR